MGNWLVPRARYAFGLVWDQGRRRSVFFAWFLFTAWSSIESQLPEKVQDDIPGIFTVFSYGPWYFWVVLGMILLAAMAIETSYRQSLPKDETNLSPEVVRAIAQLRQKDLDGFLMKYGKLLATGGGPTDFMGDRPTLQDLRILGLVEFHHFACRPSFGPEPSIGDVARDVPYLSDLGAEVYRTLEEGN